MLKLTKLIRLGRLDRRGQNYKILKNGSLEFASLEKGDEGGYKCRARNMYGEVILNIKKAFIINITIDFISGGE